MAHVRSKTAAPTAEFRYRVRSRRLVRDNNFACFAGGTRDLTLNSSRGHLCDLRERVRIAAPNILQERLCNGSCHQILDTRSAAYHSGKHNVRTPQIGS